MVAFEMGMKVGLNGSMSLSGAQDMSLELHICSIINSKNQDQ